MLGKSRLVAGAVAGAMMLAASPAWADVKAGVDAWTRGDFTAAVAAWQEPAAKGDADAQFDLAQAYRLGRGVKQDNARAEDLFGRAAAQGHIHASDNYGLMLFQRGERAKALPYIIAASDRGEPRAQYLLGIANFNGDNVPKDWVRAYALVSLAQQAGLAQATDALAQMNQYIPLEQRQRSVALAQELSMQSEATRARELAAADLGSQLPNLPTAAVVTAMPRFPPAATSMDMPVATRPIAASRVEPGADYARPRAAAVATAASAVARSASQAVPPVAHAAPVKPAAARPAPHVAASAPAAAVTHAAAPRTAAAAPAAVTAASGGNWRVQLGAFGVAANADALWERVKARPEISGHARLLVPAGAVRKLQAGGYGSKDAAQAACSRLSAAGITCIAVGS